MGVKLQKKMLVNVVFESLPELKNQIGILADFFGNRGEQCKGVDKLLEEYRGKINFLAENYPDCDETFYASHMGNIEAFGGSENFTLGINLLPGFKIDAQGRRNMSSTPFPKNPYLLECTALDFPDFSRIARAGAGVRVFRSGYAADVQLCGSLHLRIFLLCQSGYSVQRLVFFRGVCGGVRNVQPARLQHWREGGPVGIL